MDGKHRTYVIGAGASCELGLPSGDGLKSELVELLTAGREPYRESRNSVVLDAAMRDCAKPLSPADEALQDQYEAASQAIREAMPLAPSIDNFLEARSDDVHIQRVGKIAITLAIARAERASSIYDEVLRIEDHELPDPGDYTGSWHVRFFHYLASTAPSPSLLKELLGRSSFIIFNYDRCFEHFLYCMICTYYGISGEQAADMLAATSIIHPYGQIGYLPWQETSPAVYFGEARPEVILPTAGELKTFSEAVQEGTTAAVRAAIRRADDLMMLGFGFLRQNIDLLQVPDVEQPASRVRRVFATAYGSDHFEQPAIQREIGRMIRRSPTDHLPGPSDTNGYLPQLHFGTCRSMLDTHWLRFTRE